MQFFSEITKVTNWSLFIYKNSEFSKTSRCLAKYWPVDLEQTQIQNQNEANSQEQCGIGQNVTTLATACVGFLPLSFTAKKLVIFPAL